MKIILHIDMNCFFPSVETIINPKLKKLPVIVGGKNNKGVVCSANYEARKYGVKASMPMFEAIKKCQNAVLIEPNHELYQEYQEKFILLLKENFTNEIEIASIDECYMDITRLSKNKTPMQIAIQIQNLIFSKLSLPCSIGIGNNKFMAKMGSNSKKPMGITEMFERDKILKLWTLPIEKMHMIGKSTSSLLKKSGIDTIKDLAFFNINELIKVIGINAFNLHLNANGGGDDKVNKSKNIQKSFSIFQTFNKPINNYDDIFWIIKKHILKIWDFLQTKKINARTITLTGKKDFKTIISRSFTNKQVFSSFEEIQMQMLNIYDNNFANFSLKGIGCCVKIEQKYS